MSLQIEQNQKQNSAQATLDLVSKSFQELNVFEKHFWKLGLVVWACNSNYSGAWGRRIVEFRASLNSWQKSPSNDTIRSDSKTQDRSSRCHVTVPLGEYIRFELTTYCPGLEEAMNTNLRRYCSQIVAQIFFMSKVREDWPWRLANSTNSDKTRNY